MFEGEVVEGEIGGLTVDGGGDDDDAGVCGGEDVGQEDRGEEVVTEVVGLEHGFDAVGGDGALGEAEAGVADEGVDLGEALGDVFCGFADVVEAGEVEAGEVDVGVGLLSADLGDGVLAALLVAGGEDDLVSLRGKLAGGGKTDAGVAPGDQGGGHESSGWGESAPLRRTVRGGVGLAVGHRGKVSTRSGPIGAGETVGVFPKLYGGAVVLGGAAGRLGTVSVEVLAGLGAGGVVAGELDDGGCACVLAEEGRVGRRARRAGRVRACRRRRPIGSGRRRGGRRRRRDCGRGSADAAGGRRRCWRVWRRA